MSDESEVIEALVREAAAGNRAAEQQLFTQHWSLIEKMVRARRSRMGRALKDREATEDLLQDVASRVLRELPKHVWQGRRQFLAWVRSLSDYELIDRQRHHEAQRRDARVAEELPPAPPAPASRSPESRVDDNRKRHELEALLDELAPDYSAAVRMHHAGFSHAEVGEYLDCSAEAARKLVARGRAQLARLRERK